MRRVIFAVCFAFLGSPWTPRPAQAQGPDDSLDVYTEHPRLFLRPQRLRLLQRERERRSVRWVQFEALVTGQSAMPEPGFAEALYSEVSGDPKAAARAIAWALGPGADLRQLAIVFDWCQATLTDPQSKALIAKLVKLIAVSERDQSIPARRDRLLAAVALAGHEKQVSATQIESLVRGWWNRELAPALKSGRDLVPRESVYALFEILHAVRDNTNVELRDSVPVYFKNLPALHLLSHYPAAFAGPDGDYRIPTAKGVREPDVVQATMSRAAELSMVAYDTNSQDNQFLQGWLMHDAYQMRGKLGSPYEFLWANPYQPGLSYYHMALVFHDSLFGRLFVRSSWEDTATWLGYFGRELQIFEQGRPSILNPEHPLDPISLAEAIVLSANYARKFKITTPEDGEAVFVVALKPNQAYEIEVDDEEMREEVTDSGGILRLDLPSKTPVGVRLREVSR